MELMRGMDFFVKVFVGLWVVALVFVAIYLFPWRSTVFTETRSITVTGISEEQTKNEVAHYSAGVSATKDKKEDAVGEVTKKMNEIVDAVKKFGVDEADIQTQGLNIYQTQESYYEDGRSKLRPGQWSVSSTIEITLRQVDRAEALSSLLSATGATNVSGPYFSLDTNPGDESKLIEAALDNAREKAEVMAKNGGGMVGKILMINEGGITNSPIYPVYRMGGGGGGGAELQTGSSTVSKSLVVTFELR